MAVRDKLKGFFRFFEMPLNQLLPWLALCFILSYTISSLARAVYLLYNE